MMADDLLVLTDVSEQAVEARAAEVGADILAEYRILARRLRRKGWEAAAPVETAPDPTERAARRCAFQLYGTAASELDDIIADLLDGSDPPSAGRPTPALLILDGGKMNREKPDR
jgi:hypothetical protein